MIVNSDHDFISEQLERIENIRASLQNIEKESALVKDQLKAKKLEERLTGRVGKPPPPPMITPSESGLTGSKAEEEEEEDKEETKVHYY